MTDVLAPPFRLTQFARCAGCAAKMGPADLKRALAPLPLRDDPAILVGRESFDDAGVYRLSSELALVQTVDFFAPIVDDPYAFGQVAAANALSDVYAMGGEPMTALSIVGFPTGTLPLEVLTDIMRGGQDKVQEAGAVLIGGHTITDEELKFGLSVTGRVHPDRILANTGAVVGDVLILTKALGTGLVATAVKRGAATAAHEQAMLDSMVMLNRVACEAAVALRLRCATDVTGFSLLGHASHIARASGVTLRIHVSTLPVLPGAREALAAGIRTGGAERNFAYLETLVAWGSVTPEQRALAIDPQTSGGLLVACPAHLVADYLSRVPGAVVVGEVTARGEHLLVLE
ncbi:MAG: selenide, water dikinase SelD [Cytophagaceae bacterium]|nr:selenide, water dikinase SelD [Gemmatimonadaceae bacterium]